MTVIQPYGDVVAQRRGAPVGRWVRQGTTIVVIDPEFERAPEPEWGFELEQTPPCPPCETSIACRRPSRDRNKLLGTPRWYPDSRFVSVSASDTQLVERARRLVERARRYRLNCTDLSEESFRRNIAAIAYERDGKLLYEVAANEPGGLHSESVALRCIERGDRRWLQTTIRGVYSERQPCPDCTRHLKAVKKHIDRLQKERDPKAEGIYFPVFYSVEQRWKIVRPGVPPIPKENRAATLRDRYATRYTPRSGKTGVKAGRKLPT